MPIVPSDRSGVGTATRLPGSTRSIVPGDGNAAPVAPQIAGMQVNLGVQYTFRIVFSPTEKDEYAIMVTRPSAPSPPGAARENPK